MAHRRAIISRRDFLASAASAAALTAARWTLAGAQDAKVLATPEKSKAQIAITLDLEMSRNFPQWEDTHWDYEKGNLNEAAKEYTVEACRRVRARGGVIHTFVVGQVLEHPSVDWLKEIAAAGHPIGNHTYDHIYVLAKEPDELQFRFRRAPWLIRGRSAAEVIRENIVLTNIALRERVGVEARGFRTPGGFAEGLTGREDIQQLLLDLGFKWASCRYPAHAGIEDLHGTDREPSATALDNILAAQTSAQPFVYPTGLIEVPMSPISDIGAFRGGRWKLEYFLKAVRMAVARAIEQGAAFDFLAHPSCLGVVDPEFRTIDMICEMVEEAGPRAEIVDLDAIARRVGAAAKSEPADGGQKS